MGAAVMRASRPAGLLPLLIAAEAALLALALFVPRMLPFVLAAAVAPWVLTSIPRALTLALAVLVILPEEGNRYAVMPLGLSPAAVGAIAVVPFAAFFLVRLARRDLSWRRTALDPWVAVLLLAVALGGIRGALRGPNSFFFKTDVIEWSLYATFFVATQGIADSATARRIWTGLIVCAAIVAVEFFWISLTAPHAEFARFSRVVTYQVNIFALAVPALAARLLCTPRRWALSALLLTVVMIGVFLAQMRSLFLAAGAGVAVVALIAGGRALPLRRMAALAVIFVVSAGIAFGVVQAVSHSAGLPFEQSLRLRSEALGAPKQAPAVAVRLVTYRTLWEGRIRRDPILGSGLGDEISFPAGVTLIREYNHVDNAYLTTWWKLGLPGLAALAGVLVAGFVVAAKAYRRLVDPADRAVVLGAAGTIAAITTVGLATVVPAQLRFDGVWATTLALPLVLMSAHARRAGSAPVSPSARGAAEVA